MLKLRRNYATDVNGIVMFSHQIGILLAGDAIELLSGPHRLIRLLQVYSNDTFIHPMFNEIEASAVRAGLFDMHSIAGTEPI